jgi:hypothetical protein
VRYAKRARKSYRSGAEARQPGIDRYSDGFRSYNRPQSDYVHNVINHTEKYVDEKIHTNGIENFWSLLMRSIKGTYGRVETVSPVRLP